MGGDVASGTAAGVLGDEVAEAVDEAAGPGDGAADAVQLAQFAGGDADQGDEVVRFPETVDVTLAEADAAAQRAAPGGGVVDGDGGAEVGVGWALAAFAGAFEDIDAAVADAAKDGADAGSGERVAGAGAAGGRRTHGETNPFGRLPSGWGW